MSHPSVLLGFRAEKVAADFLRKKKYRIREMNFKTPLGEIDIVAEDSKGILVFAEVKYRKNSSFGGPWASVGKRKQMRVVKSAILYIKENRLVGRQFRFDVLAVNLNQVTHLPHAFQAQGYTF